MNNVSAHVAPAARLGFGFVTPSNDGVCAKHKTVRGSRHKAGMTSDAGFSLVELSIVLVILGLLVGGVLSGQSLIRASQLRNLTNQVTAIQTASGTFRDKYFGMAGDITNAQSFFGAADPGICANSSSSFTDAVWNSARTATCNGDGNGMFSENVSDRFRFFQQLANAGLITGQYSGVWFKGSSDPSTACDCHNYKSGVNSPSTAFTGVSLATVAMTAGSGIFTTNPLYMVNVLIVGADTRDSNRAGFIKTDELYNIDTKLDDGRPGSGMVMSQSCESDGWHLTSAATYTLSDATSTCYFYVRL